jgi:hypothetical protein
MTEEERDEQLVALRPEVPVLLSDEMSADERIQNSTLRPILKGMNERLLQVFVMYAQQRKGAFWAQAPERQADYIQHVVQKDAKLKHLLLGMVISQFTEAEWEQYLLLEKELRRRIATLIIQRLQDQINVLRVRKPL